MEEVSFKKVKIIGLEGENLKKIALLELYPEENGITVIGGPSDAGKTTALQMLEALLKNKAKFIKDSKRKGSSMDESVKTRLSNGIDIEYSKGKIQVNQNGATVGSAAILKGILSDFALDIPKFLSLSQAEMEKMLLKSFGVGDELEKLKKESEKLKAKRLNLFDVKEHKIKSFNEMPYFQEVEGEKEKSPSELMEQNQAAVSKNAENMRIRQNATQIENNVIIIDDKIKNNGNTQEVLKNQLENIKKQIEEKEKESIDLQAQKLKAEQESITAKKSIENLVDENLDETKKMILDYEKFNEKISTNKTKETAKETAEIAQIDYDESDTAVKENAKKQKELLSIASNKLPSLELKNGKIYYDGFKWTELSTSYQTRAAVAILLEIDPDAGFCFIDRIESLDPKQITLLNEFCIENDLQIIGTRVCNNEIDEQMCDLVFEDGEVKFNKTLINKPEEKLVEEPKQDEGEMF